MANMDYYSVHGTSAPHTITAGGTAMNTPNPIGWTLQSRTPTTLHKFRKLPAELRIKIWKGATPGARVVEVRFGKAYKSQALTCAPPAPLHTCHESREVMKIRYDQLIIHPINSPGTSLTYTWIDYSRDIIYLSLGAGDTFSFYNRCVLEVLQQMTKLSIRPPMLQNVALDVLNVMPAVMDTTLLTFPNLKNLMLVMSDPGISDQRCTESSDYNGIIEGYMERDMDDSQVVRWRGRGQLHNAYMHGKFLTVGKIFANSLLAAGMSRATLRSIDIHPIDIKRAGVEEWTYNRRVL